MSVAAIFLLIFACCLGALALVALFIMVTQADGDAFIPFIILGGLSALLILGAVHLDDNDVVKNCVTKQMPTEVVHSKYETIVFFGKEMHRFDAAKEVNLIKDTTTFLFHWDIQKDGDTIFKYCEPILIEKTDSLNVRK